MIDTPQPLFAGKGLSMIRHRFLIISLLSLSLIAQELSWTRVLSAEFFYTFAFLVLSLAMLGLGIGGLLVRLCSSLDRPERLWVYLSLTAVASMAGPPAVFALGLKFSALFAGWEMIGKLVIAIVLLSSSFLFGGIALAILFKHNHQDMPRLYMADLLGAGGGVVVALFMMNQIGTPQAVFLLVIPTLTAALLAARGAWRITAVLLATGAIALSVRGDQVLELSRPEPAPVIYKHWDATAKIKVYGFSEDYRGLNIDNIANSPVYRFDGVWDRPDSLRYEFGIDVSWLIGQFDSCTFLSLGAGGGSDVLQALQAGATEIHAVEVIPHVNRMMLEDDLSGYFQPATGNDAADSDSATNDNPAPTSAMSLAEFSGYIYRDPRVVVATEDARAYVRRYPGKFDVIYSLSSNTWAALASGSFALAENYLFTTEAFRDYWYALSDSGFLTMEHQFYMPRMVSEVVDALAAAGVDSPRDHFAVYNLPAMRRNLLLLSKRPLTDSIRYYAFGALTPDRHEALHLLYPAADSLSENLINRVVRDGWRAHALDADIDLSPATDNRPYIAQMGLWRNFDSAALDKVLPYEFFGFPLSTLIIVVILATVIVLVIPLNLLPYALSARKLRAAPWLYFFAIGAAFMAIEIVLIQKYTLFVGPSVYSIAVILLSLLLGSGIGSRFADRVPDALPFLGIAAWLFLDVLLFEWISSALAGTPMSLRMSVTAGMVLPLGFLMGMPFPKGTLRVKDLIDWGFAVNGAASVVGSTVILLVAFNYGFTVSLLLAGSVYLVAFGLFSLKRAW